jgi:hypothetical protein
MTLKTNEAAGPAGKAQEPIDPGTYPGQTVQIIDLGLQAQVYLGETKDPKNEIMTTYELADEFMKDEEGNDIEDKPRWVSETFTLNSLNSDKAKSTQRYYALDPNVKYDGDWSKLLGVPASITIVNKPGKGKNAGKVYNNIGNVSAMRPRDAERLPKLKNDPKFFTLDDPDVEVFLSLPTWVQDKIKGGLEFKGSKLDNLLQNHKGANDGKPVPAKENTREGNEETGEGGENW